MKQNGKLKFFDITKGFGFIAMGDVDVFFLAEAVLSDDDLGQIYRKSNLESNVGRPMSFCLCQRQDKRFYAIDVELMS